MFCDLVGSTALAARLDPEDMSNLILAFHGAVSAATARFGGNVAKLMGDGALIYFGYPHAHEDDAQRAAHAGLALVAAVAALPREDGLALQVRAGIATGLVVVGELIASAGSSARPQIWRRGCRRRRRRAASSSPNRPDAFSAPRSNWRRLNLVC